MDQEAIIVGRDANCDIRIDSLPVAAQHFRIEQTGHGAEAISLQDKLPLIINRKTVSGKQLEHGDTFDFKNYSLEYVADEVNIALNNHRPQSVEKNGSQPSIKPDHTQAMAVLQNLDGDQYGDIVPLSRSMMKLGGKSLGGSITICHRRDGYFISILSGTPMVCVDGQALTEKGRYLQDGCLLQLGNKHARFYLQQLASAS